VSRASWHARTTGLVLAWAVALLVVVLTHPFLPVAGWLLVHVLALGVVSNAILVWTWHFAEALLRLGDADRPAQARRLVLLNGGVLVLVAGMTSAVAALVVTGAALVVGAVTWHLVDLLRRVRRALGNRFAVTVRYYVAAAVALLVGVVLGTVLGVGGAGAAAEELRFAHLLLNVLGWVGLTVLGTLVTLWPTMLRTRIADGAVVAARRGFVLLVAGLGVAAVGAGAGATAVVAAGLLGYAGGLVVLLVPMVRVARQRAPQHLATLSVGAGTAWLLGSVLGLAGVAATAPDLPVLRERTGWLVAALLVGVVAQVLVGALSYLVPVVLGGGPARVRAASATLDRVATLRLTAANLGLLVCLLPVPSVVRVTTSLVVFVALASVVPLMLRVLWRHRRATTAPGDLSLVPSAGAPAAVGDGVPGGRGATRLRGLLSGAGVVALAVAAGVAVDPLAAGLGTTDAAAGVTPTGRTTTVVVEAQGMRFEPDVVEVPAGDRLVVELVNADTDVHDLVLASGQSSGRLAPGERAALDLGVVGTDLQGWCSVAGHRQMGMELDVVAVGAPPGTAAGHPDEGEHGVAGAEDGTGTGGGVSAADLMQDPGPTFAPYDPVLRPAPDAVVHRHRLVVREEETEVAPGVMATAWTFGGTVPGPVLRGRVGDTFEVTLVNDGTIGHSIDFHAGALAPDRPMRTIAPGEELTYTFTATRAGIWMYHCSTMPMSVHIANGMFGAVVIDPPDLPDVDRELVLVQSEMYLGADGEEADAAKVAEEQPDLVVFNGYANQYAHAPIEVRVGERVRVWVLDAGPSRSSAFHVVGGQFDTVWTEGAYTVRSPDGPDGAQVLPLVPAQGGFVELVFPEAGTYPLVSHIMVDAERGAHGVFRVTD
jgi:nitrite reductase (NO-forming)